jgi:septum formation protein
MSDKKYSLVLGSKSPRRKELLGWLNIPFEIITSHAEERSDKGTPKEVAEDIARVKGDAVYKKCAETDGYGKTYFPLVIASDTIVVLGDKILGKPTSVDDARSMLKSLAGKTHLVITGVYIGFLDIKTGKISEKIFSSQTDVQFDEISDDLLENYLATGESMDKAGSYGIQGKGLTFISNLNGSYSNVVGFPLNEFVAQLKAVLGFPGDDKGLWRDVIHGAR